MILEMFSHFFGGRAFENLLNYTVNSIDSDGLGIIIAPFKQNSNYKIELL